MGQRTSSRTPSRRAARENSEGSGGAELAVFPSALGWFAILGRDGKLVALTFAHPTAGDARQAMNDRKAPLLELHGADVAGTWTERDWNSELREQLERFAKGEPIEFGDCALRLPAMTEFQKRVVNATRKLRYGETATYAEVAKKAGNPGAARAVGNVMRSNPIPLVIPCHRVVGAGGLGGYSGPQGLELKRSLLEMEAPLAEEE